MKVLVWLSWWVDSAVSTYLLKKQWYEVFWWFMINYKDSWNENCQTKIDLREAKNVANFLDIDIEIFDFSKEYERLILNYLYEWYKKWITPNPDIFCNNLIKFDLFLNEAKKLWFDKIATWHYANIKCDKSQNLCFLYKWIDPKKDQSYFLSWLNQFQLKNSIFPIWNLLKTDVRKIAKKIWLPNAERKDSQWLCFVWNVKMRDFLMKKIKSKKWDIIEIETWKKLWEHQWAYFFTIWQRHWLFLNSKFYVVKTDVLQNNVFVSKNKNHNFLLKNEVFLEKFNRISVKKKLPLIWFAKIRHVQTPQKAILKEKNWQVFIDFFEKQRSVVKWQIAVFYDWDQCIWNWVIL